MAFLQAGCKHGGACWAELLALGFHAQYKLVLVRVGVGTQVHRVRIASGMLRGRDAEVAGGSSIATSLRTMNTRNKL